MNEFEVRRRLRELPVEQAPERDLWPGIAARLHAPAAGSRRRWGYVLPAALAAALTALAVFAPRPAFEPGAPDRAGAEVETNWLAREARTLEIEYRAALATLPPVPLPAEQRAALRTLDASTAALRDALREQPEARYLLDQLRRTHDRRLRLTQPFLPT